MKQRAPSPTFEELLAGYGKVGYMIANDILDHYDDANDAMQNAMTKAWLNFPRLKDKQAFFKWMNKIVKNCCYDLMKTNKRFNDLSLNYKKEEDDEEWMEYYVDNRQDMEQEILDDIEVSEKIQLVKQAIVDLPTQQRTMVTLRYMHNLTEKEAAKIAGVKHGTVKSQSSRGLAALRKRLA